MLQKCQNEKMNSVEIDKILCQNQLHSLINKPNKNRLYNEDFKDNEERLFTISQTVKSTCHILEYKKSTFFLAVNIFNSVLSKYSIKHELYEKIALVCVSLASKITESQDSALNLSAINSYILVSNFPLVDLERKILKSLDFDLNYVTVFDCLSVFKEFPHLIFIKSSEEIALEDKFRDYLELLDSVSFLVSTAYVSNKFTPLVVSVVIIMITRKLSAFQSIYPEMLQKITNFPCEYIFDCYVTLSQVVFTTNKQSLSMKSDFVQTCAHEKNSLQLV